MTNAPSTAEVLLAIGLDAADIPRIDEAIRRWGARFLHRVFTSGEIAYCTRRRLAAPSFAARFAAKEAAMKALGTGHSRGVLWKDIEVVRQGGPPELRFHGAAAQRFEWLGARRSLVTLTHSDVLALAQVALLGDSPSAGAPR